MTRKILLALALVLAAFTVGNPPADAASRASCAPLKSALLAQGLSPSTSQWLAYTIAWRETGCGAGLTGRGVGIVGCHRDSDDYTCSRWALNFHPRVMGHNAWVRLCGIPDRAITSLRNLSTDAGCVAKLYRACGRSPWAGGCRRRA